MQNSRMKPIIIMFYITVFLDILEIIKIAVNKWILITNRKQVISNRKLLQ